MSLSDTNPNVLDLCRLCLGKDERLIPVFDNLHTNQVLCDKINVCLAIQISSEDRISQKICTSCYIKVDSFYEFRNTSSESQRVLERWLQNTENTLTDLNPQEANNIIKDGNSLFIDDVTSDEESDDRDSLSDGDNNLNPVETSESLQLIQENDELPSVSNDDLITLLPATNEDPGPSGLHSTDTVALIEFHSSIPLFTSNKETDVQKDKNNHSEFAYTRIASFESGVLLNNNNFADHSSTRVSVQSSNGLNHKKEIHTKKALQCNICKFTAKYKSQLEIHLKRHKKDYRIFCDVCNRGFFYQHEIKLHKAVHAEDNKFECPVCQKKFVYQHTLVQHSKKHKAVHSEKGKFKCDVCDKTFADKSYLRKHTYIHSGVNKVICDICGLVLSNSVILKAHYRTHTGERPYSCSICGKSFNTKTYISIHMRMHTGDKPFKCHVCNKLFAQQSSLNVHKRYHSGERPYECHICKKAFVTKTILKIHQQKHSF